MNDSLDAPRWLKLALRTLIVLVASIVVVLIGVVVLSSYLRGPAVRYVEAHYGRRVSVEGYFELHLLALHPRIVVERVTVGNPSWIGPGKTAKIGHLSITYDWPWFGRPWGVRRLEMRQAELYLSRDEAGRANWLTRDPDTGSAQGPPLIRSLSVPDARVHLDDRRRNLQFEGTVSAEEVPVRGPYPALQIKGEGRLNGRDASFRLQGDPLVTVTHDHPYRFEFVETSSGSQLHGTGLVARPFNFSVLTMRFDAKGEDLKDLYFLTGIKLIDTGSYHASGRFERREGVFRFTDLEATSGGSDIRATVSIERASLSATPHIEADLRSKVLRLADLGARAAGRAPKTGEQASRYLIPDVPFHLRPQQTVVHFHAATLEASKLTLGAVTAQLSLEVHTDVPKATLDAKVGNLKVGGPPADDRPQLLEGALRGRLHLQGQGKSLHAMASKANGTVTAVLPHGEVRSSVAELAGLNLRGLGLAATGSNSNTAVRCGVASFEAKQGLLTAQRVVLDTEPVLITGEGNIDLESEGMDLKLRSSPKHPRLRIRAPLLVQGTLRHPSVSAAVAPSAGQAGAAVALGVLLTPVAAMLAFVDPGLAKDTDCSALLAQVPAQTTTPQR